MDFWKSEYEDGHSTSSALAGLQELVNSPNVSRDSIEYSSDDPSSITSDPAESLKIKQQATLLAKRRLQAYSSVNKFKPGNAKDETSITDKPLEKVQKTKFKKLKKSKTIYPDDAAKAVIRDIEILKRAGYGGPPPAKSVLPSILGDMNIPLESLLPISLGKLNIDISPTISLYSDNDEDHSFRKREIKCRNIRKSDTIRKRSPSPKNTSKGNKTDKGDKKEKKEYPLNWTEYKELNLNPHKDALLKSKLFKKPRSKHFSFKRYFNFESPPPPIEIYKCQPISGDALWIPFPHIRSTATRPPVLYSTNKQVASPGYLTRAQLFSVIPTERKDVIEKLWKEPSRCQPSYKKNTSRKWYPRNWRKFENSEAKLLEKSVGLSFLQSYSDEDEEEENLGDNNEENVEKELDLKENKGTSPSATPKEQRKNFDQEIEESYEVIDNWDASSTSQVANVVITEKTPPIEEKEEGEVSLDDSPKNISEDEYRKTKKELESLEEALKKSTSILEDLDKDSFEKTPVKQAKKIKEKNNKNSREEKESKSRKKKKSKKIKNKQIDDSDDAMETSDFKEELVQKRKEKKKKAIKDKEDKKEKRRKARKKKSKKKKEEVDTNSESEDNKVESDIERKVPKKIRKKKRKSTNKSKGGSTSEELSGKVQHRKSSVDITHEGYEDDVKFFTARFDNEDDLKGKTRHKKDEGDNSKIIHNKKTNIQLDDLPIALKPVINTKRKSKRGNSESGELLPLENIQQKNEFKERHSERKQSNERNKIKDEAPKMAEDKDEGKKDEGKVDLLKKNAEYLREQDKLRVKQQQKKSSSDDLNSTLKKTSESSIRSEDESQIVLKNQKVEKYKTNEPKSSGNISEPKEPERDKIKLVKSPKKVPKDLPGNDLNITDKLVIEFSEAQANSKQTEPTLEIRTEKTQKDTTKPQNINNREPLKVQENISSIVDERNLNNLSGIQSNEVQKRPDWEKLKSKRKRHISDATQEKVEKVKRYSKKDENTEAEMFPLEKDLPMIHIKTEKEDDSYTNPREGTPKPNTSWETDEEVFEARRRSAHEENLLNLEIPLNIKHFPRREVKIENDILDSNEELTQFHRHSRDLSAERKKLEIEKMKVKRLERKLLQVQEKELQQNTRPFLKTKRDEREQEETNAELNVQTPPKKRRWDIKASDSAMSTPKIKMESSIEIIDVDANTPNNTVTLENEYEEFLKAVTSTKKESLRKPILIDSSSDSSIILNDEQKSKHQFELNSGEEMAIKKRSPFKQVITNLDDLISEPKETIPVIDIPTIQIPLPPTKPEEIRPVPVPLPKLEAVFDLNKPLINLSLSANVTQNITLSLAPSITSFSAPITSSIDISKTSVEISTPVSKDTVVSMNNIPLPVSKTVNASNSASNLADVKLTTIPTSPKIETVLSPKTQLFNFEGETNLPTIACESSPGLENTYPIDRATKNTPTKQKIVFATLTLPTKKQLLNNSKLNLDDSDNDDQSIIEELKRKKLEALIEDNKKEVLIEEVNKHVSIEENPFDESRAKSPVNNKQIKKLDPSAKTGSHKSVSKHDSSPRRKRESPLKKKELSPRRRSPRRRSPRKSPRRRSPTRKRSPHRRRSPGRRTVSPRKRRSISPRKRRSPSPRRKRSTSPKNRQLSPRRNRSISPKNKRRSLSPRSKTNRHSTSSQRPRSPKSNDRKKSPVPLHVSSPFGAPKRSVADSTISDDQLPQSTSNDDYNDNIFSHFHDKNREPDYDSPKRVPLDVRISQVLGYDVPCEEPQKPTSSTAYNYNDHQQMYQYTEQYSNIESQVTTPTMRTSINQSRPQSCYKQVGNMLQILPSDNLIDIPIPEPPYQVNTSHLAQFTHQSSYEVKMSGHMDIKPQILQVGNMLQIVPTEMIPTEMIPVPPIHTEYTEVKLEDSEEILPETLFMSPLPEKPSAEAAMLKKIAERREERENRRQERERRRREKERRNKEKEKVKQARMKIKTENMIKRALEMEQEDAEADISEENPIQWPPTPIVVAHSLLKEAGRSILLTSSNRNVDLSTEEKLIKIVKFADGIRPGEGTSPSAGEELSSPPPPKKKLPKEKRFKKMKFTKKSTKKKVKVKIIKKPPSPLIDSDSEDNLPPPSPPPGSPPPHVFPPRIKVNSVNNVPAAYLASIIQTAQQQQQQQLQQQQQHLQHQQKLQQQQQQQQYQSNLYCPSINLLMAPPPPPQGHPHHQSPHGTAVPPAASPHGSQSHFHPSLAQPPPPPPPVSPHNHYPSSSSGHHRHY